MRINELKRLIEQAYIEVLLEQDKEPAPEDLTGDDTAGPETVLEDATDTMLEKFPTLKATLVKLMTQDFKEFVKSVDWISPRPTSFRINLSNGQDFSLKWTGKTFDAQIQGKNYALGKISEFQQALDRLGVLYQEAPLTGAGLEGEPGAEGETGSGAGGGAGDFPGGEDAAFAEPGAEAPEGGEEAGGADLGGEEIDFEAGAEPEV